MIKLSLLTIALFASMSANAAFTVYMPLEQKLNGSLPNGTIKFGSEQEETTEPDDSPKLLKSFNFTIDENIAPWLSANPYGIPQFVQNKNFGGVTQSVQFAIELDETINATKKINSGGVSCSPDKFNDFQNGKMVLIFTCENITFLSPNAPVGTSVKVDFYDK